MNNFLKGFVYAFSGLFFLVKSERNFQIHLVLFCLVLFLGCYFNITSLDWILILIVSSIVFGLEALNTAIEKLCDLVDPNFNTKIKTIKDISAAAVLIASIMAAVSGVILLWKYLF